MIFCRLLINQNKLFPNILSGIISGCQTVWIQIRPNILSGLIWVQTVCKDYPQKTKVVISRQIVNIALSSKEGCGKPGQTCRLTSNLAGHAISAKTLMRG